MNDHVDHMTAEVVHHSAFEFAEEAAVSGIAGDAHLTFHAEDASEFPLILEIERIADGRISAEHVAESENEVLFFCKIAHAVELFRILAARLVHVGVITGFEGTYRGFNEFLFIGFDDEGVRFAPQGLFPADEGESGIGRSVADFFAARGVFFDDGFEGVEFAETAQSGCGVCGVNRRSGSDLNDAQFFHEKISLFEKINAVSELLF